MAGLQLLTVLFQTGDDLALPDQLFQPFDVAVAVCVLLTCLSAGMIGLFALLLQTLQRQAELLLLFLQLQEGLGQILQALGLGALVLPVLVMAL